MTIYELHGFSGPRGRAQRQRRSSSAAQARRIALAAQGLADRRPAGRVDRRHVRRVLDRVGPHPDRLGQRAGALAGAAAVRAARAAPARPAAPDGRRRGGDRVLVPRGVAAADRHLAAHALADAQPGRGLEGRVRDRPGGPGLVEAVLEEVARAGAADGGRPAPSRGGDRRRCGAGARASARSSTCSGAARSRPAGAPSDFARLYDLTERVVAARGPGPARARPRTRRSASCC